MWIVTAAAAIIQSLMLILARLSQRLNIIVTAYTESITNRREHVFFGSAVRAVAIGTTINNNRVSMLIGEQRFFTVMTKNAQLTPGGHQLIFGIGGMRTVTTGTLTGGNRTVNNFFVRNTIVTFIAERSTLSRKHVSRNSSMGIVTRGTPIIKS
jgi:hypothetical protein